MTSEKSYLAEDVADKDISDVSLVQQPEQKSNSAPDPMVGKTVANRFEIHSLIGSGGMSSVYLAKHLLLDKMVAIKFIHPDRSVDDKAMMRFQQEAKASTALNHSNIVKVYDFGMDEEDRPYLVMELVEGKSLAALIKEGALASERAIDLMLQACLALHHAHEKGIVHRDIKPENMIVSTDADGKEQVRIVDFGIAKILSVGEAQQLTQTGEIFGSPLYMSPEQCRGKSLDARSDVYSLSCTFYEMLTGEPPFRGANAVETIFQHMKQKPPRFKRGSNIPSGLEKIVMRGLEKDPASRYQSMRALCVDLERVKAGQTPAFHISARSGIGMFVISCALLLSLAVFLTGFLGSTGAEWRALDKKAIDAAGKNDYAGAELWLGRAVAAAERVHAANSELADLYGQEGNYANSEEHYELAIDCFKKGATYAEKANDLGGAVLRWRWAGSIAMNNHKEQEATDLFKRAADTQARLNGPDSSNYADLLRDLGRCYVSAEVHDYKRGEEAFQKAIAIYRRLDDKQKLEGCYTDLAATKDLQNDYVAAADLYKQAADERFAAKGNQDHEWRVLMHKRDSMLSKTQSN